MPQTMGKCPGCDETGELGAACEERGCKKRGYHFIPTEYWESAHRGRNSGPDPMIGQIVGDFLVVDFIGAGGFGRVYLALQAPLLRLRGALKLLEFPTENVMLTQALLQKFQGEAEALAQLTHPNIVRLLKYGTHGDRPYLVMEYVDEGETLRDEIYLRAQKGESFSHEQLRHVFDQILNGLEAAHAQNIIHRDIKPENVMLQRVVGNPLHVRILDFGTAKFVENQADTKWPLGSPSYMAPEQVGLKNLGPWSDLYAVGVIVYELLSGRKPFPGETENEIVARKMDVDFDPLQRLVDINFPQEVIDFLRTALEREPSDRFQDVPAFRSGLHEIFDELQDLSGPLGTGGRELTDLANSDAMSTVSANATDATGGTVRVTPNSEEDVADPRPPQDTAVAGGDGGDRKNHSRLERAALIAGMLLLLIVGAGLILMNTFGRDVDEWIGELATEQTKTAAADVGQARDSGPPDAGTKAVPVNAPDTASRDATTDSDAEADAGDLGILAFSGDENRRIRQVAAGKFHTCALVRPSLEREETLVRCWGANFDGELGIGNTETIGDDEPAHAASYVTIPERPVELASAGDRQASFNCVRTVDGKVLCWGANRFGQLGYGHTRQIGDNESPAMAAGFVKTGGQATQLVIGASKYASHACVLLEGGRVRCWGGNNFGQLGYGHTQSIGDNETPMAAGLVSLGGSAVELAAGKYHNCAVLHDGTLRCWGWNKHGQLGYGHTNDIGDDEVPSSTEPVALGAKVVHLGLGRRHSCAVVEGGKVRCWGWNDHGQLGYGHTDDIGDDEPPFRAGDVDVGGVVQRVSAGELHTCALMVGGEVRCWGDNKFGQLGLGHTSPIGASIKPSAAGTVQLGAKAISISAGAYHTCAVLDTDAVRCWGYNKFGQLGYGHTNDIGDDEIPMATGVVPILPD